MDHIPLTHPEPAGARAGDGKSQEALALAGAIRKDLLEFGRLAGIAGLAIHKAQLKVDQLLAAAPAVSAPSDERIDAIVDRHFRHKNHPDSYVALRETIKDAIASFFPAPGAGHGDA